MADNSGYMIAKLAAADAWFDTWCDMYATPAQRRCDTHTNARREIARTLRERLSALFIPRESLNKTAISHKSFVDAMAFTGLATYGDNRCVLSASFALVGEPFRTCR